VIWAFRPIVSAFTTTQYVCAYAVQLVSETLVLMCELLCNQSDIFKLRVPVHLPACYSAYAGNFQISHQAHRHPSAKPLTSSLCTLVSRMIYGKPQIGDNLIFSLWDTPKYRVAHQFCQRRQPSIVVEVLRVVFSSPANGPCI
jgi:hypothetical protein